MDFSFSEEQTLLRNTIQSFIQDNYDFDKRQAIVKSEEGMKQENWKQFSELGLLGCLLYTSPSPRDLSTSRMPSSA